MKVLCLSDLHLYFVNSDIKKFNEYKKDIQKLLSNIEFDCIVISGDIFEYHYNGNPYKELRDIFSFISQDIPIICCLGNHEFAYSTIDKTHKKYASIPKENRYNVYYLDVDNTVEFNGYNFVGNVFWYDNSLINNLFCKPDKIVDSWLDSTIQGFIPSIENAKCKEQIVKNLKLNKKNILVTHTVPHKDINGFSYSDPTSIFNQYSGCADFLKEIKDKNIVLSISGHTHKREMKEIYNIPCINIGNDYYRSDRKIMYYVADV